MAETFKSKADHIRHLLQRGWYWQDIAEETGYSRGSINHARRSLINGGPKKRGRKLKREHEHAARCPTCGQRLTEADADTVSLRIAQLLPADPSAPTP